VGHHDSFAVAEAPTLVERFVPRTREALTWPGPHTVPTRGPAADRIVEFIEQRGTFSKA